MTSASNCGLLTTQFFGICYQVSSFAYFVKRQKCACVHQHMCNRDSRQSVAVLYMYSSYSINLGRFLTAGIYMLWSLLSPTLLLRKPWQKLTRTNHSNFCSSPCQSDTFMLGQNKGQEVNFIKCDIICADEILGQSLHGLNTKIPKPMRIYM